MITRVPQFLHPFRKPFWGMMIVLLLINACVTNSELVLSKLDPETSVTIAYNKSPLIFFRSPPTLRADAREYAYVGPVEVNRSGDYRYYLWLATWSTMDSGYVEPPRDRFESIELIADDKPITLKIGGGTVRAIGASEPVYPKPVGWATENYYDVTLDQLRLIAEATALQLRFTSSGESYEPWDDQKSSKAGLLEFLVRSEF